jgi:tRNA G18 (ribose-2'-O)-methylase SpoU
MVGYYGIGIYCTKNKRNIGTLWRSAQIFGASFIYTILAKYNWQPTDTLKSYRHVPLFHHDELEHFLANLPMDCTLVGVELVEDAEDIVDFNHPKRAVYLLGAEDTGLPPEVLALCKKVVKLPGKYSMNVSHAGSLIMYDRLVKSRKH